MDYTYAVARVRAMETGLMSEQELDRLINAADYEEAKRAVHDRDLSGDISELDDIGAPEPLIRVLRLPVDYHNIKAAVKSVFSDTDPAELMLKGGTEDSAAIYESVKTREYGRLSPELAYTAERAMKLLLQTQDGQLCDMFIDNAMLEGINKAAAESGDDFIKAYAEMKADIANLKASLRCAVMGKGLSFTENALYNGGTLNHELLAKAAAEGAEPLKAYVAQTAFSDLAELVTQNPAEFEKKCDDRITELMDNAKYESFSAAPILAYAHAKQVERSAIRLVLSAKESRISNDIIRERVRRLYV